MVMPIVLPITNALGISPTLVILTYCMADGFSFLKKPLSMGICKGFLFVL